MVADSARKQERQQAEQAKARKRAAQVEDGAWALVNVEACVSPTTADACDHVEQFLEKYPRGVHALEAREALDLGEPVIAKLKADEQAWQEANPAACQNPSTSRDCEGVMAYFEKYPNGAHAEEAKEIVIDAQPAIEKLAAKERAGGSHD